jgi:WD40 repeat protein
MPEYHRARYRKATFFSRKHVFAGILMTCVFYVFVGEVRLFAHEFEVRLILRGMNEIEGNWRHVAISPNGKILAFGAIHWGIGLWDLAGGKLQRKLTYQDGEEVKSCINAFSPNGRILASGDTSFIQLWDVATGKMKGFLKVETFSDIHCLAFTPDGKTLASSDHQGHTFLWDLSTRKLRATLRHPRPHVRSLAISPDGKVLATSADFDDILLWRVDTGKPCGRLKKGPVREPWHLVFTRDGKSLVAAHDSRQGELNLWDLATRKATCIYQHHNSIENMILSPDGRTLAFWDRSIIHLFDLLARQKRASLSMPGSFCGSMAFSPDGRTLAAGRNDADVCVILFDLASVKGIKAPDASELSRLWKRLGSSDAPDAFRAIRILSAFPRQAVPFLRQHMRPLPPPTAAQLAAGARYVPDLDSDDFATRQKAYEELRKAGECAEDALRRALAGRPSPEVRKKAQALLGRIVSNRTARPLQRHRVLEVLEHMDDADARSLLAELAKDAPEASIRQEAKDSLARVRKRPPPTIIKPLPPETSARPKAVRPKPR